MPAVPYIIQGGAQIGSALIAQHGQSDAADKQADAIEKGIALQEKMYDQDRADLAGYRGLGQGAIGNLAYLSGIDMPAPSATPTTAAPVGPQAPKESLAQLGANPNTTSTWGTALGTSVDRVNQAMDVMNSGKLGPTTNVTKGGKTRVIPTSLLTKALAEGYTQVP